MKYIHADIEAARHRRAGTTAHGLLWVRPRHRTTGAEAGIGFWTGDDHQVFNIGGQTRTYYAAGAALDLGESVAEIGIAVRTRTVVLSGLPSEVNEMARVYDARLAPVEIHRAEFDPLTGARIAPGVDPERVFKGFVDQVTWRQDAETATCLLTLASSARALTRPLALKYSDASQKLLNGADNFFKYVETSGTVDVYWGEKRISAPGQTDTYKGPANRRPR